MNNRKAFALLLSSCLCAGPVYAQAGANTSAAAPQDMPPPISPQQDAGAASVKTPKAAPAQPDTESASSADQNKGKCGVDVICMPKVVRDSKQSEIAYRAQVQDLEHKLNLATLKANIQAQMQKVKESGGSASVPTKLPVATGVDVPKPDFKVTHFPSRDEHSDSEKSSLDGIKLKAIVNGKDATFSVGGEERDVALGDSISGYKLVGLDFDKAKLKAPNQPAKTLYVNW